ncbi:MAG: YdcF family protein [Spirochaetales bacterium]|nr:YdcF family protein [Spirochaetales bacterium]
MDVFFVLSKVIPLLLYPLPLALLILFVGSFVATPRYDREKGRAFRRTVRFTALALWLLASPWFTNLLVKVWEYPRQPLSALPTVSDAAIVLGGLSDPVISTPTHLEFNEAAERITEAVQLYREGRVKNLVISSGSGDLTHPHAAEAPGLATWAESMGVNPENIFVEDRSRNTRENAEFSRQICDAQGFHSFVLITSAFHMPRALAVFKKAGFEDGGRHLIPWPVDTREDSQGFPFNLVPTPHDLDTVQTFVKEMVGMLVYHLMGFA